MVQILHRYNTGYPFGLEKQSDLTFVDLRKDNLSQQQISDYRLKYKILKEIICPNIIKLVKIMKDEHNMHLLYEYYPLSLLKYIENFFNKNDTKNETILDRQFIDIVITSLNKIIESLIHFQIKTDLLINSIAIQQNQQNTFLVKIFIHPDFDCVGLRLPFSTEHPDVIKKRIQESRISLSQHYRNQKNNIVLQLETLIKNHYKKNQQIIDKNTPNFIIKGTKLIFIDKEIQKSQNQMKKNTVNQNESDKDNQEISESTKNEKTVDDKKDLKQKNIRRIQEIKNNLNHLYEKNKYAPQQIPSNSHEKTVQQKVQNDLVFHKKLSNHQKQQKPVTSKLQQAKLDHPNQPPNQETKTNKYKMKLIASKEVQVIGLTDKKVQKIDLNHLHQIKTNNQKNDKIQNEQKQFVHINEQNTQTNQKYSQVKQKVKLRANEIGSANKKINQLMNRLNMNVNLAQIHQLNTQNPQQVKAASNKYTVPNPIPQGDNFVQKYQDKIKEAKNKAKQILKDYSKSQNSNKEP